jgi:hypothetical protein
MDAKELWSRAQAQVEADVEVPQNMAEVDKLAAELQPQLGFR